MSRLSIYTRSILNFSSSFQAYQQIIQARNDDKKAFEQQISAMRMIVGSETGSSRGLSHHMEKVEALETKVEMLERKNELLMKALESERSSVKELEEDLKIAVEQGMKYRDALQKLLQVHERCGRVAGRSEGEQDRVVALEAQLQDKDKEVQALRARVEELETRQGREGLDDSTLSEDGNAHLATFALLQTPERSRIAHRKNASMLQTPQFDQQASMQAIESLLAATEGSVTEVGSGTTSLAKSLSKVQHLTHLDLGDNHIDSHLSACSPSEVGDEGGEALAAALRNGASSLTSLHLNSNSIGAEGMFALLYLRGNLTDSLQAPIPAEGYRRLANQAIVGVRYRVQGEEGESEER
ncbi:hypothetical protein GUITHDRAFT_132251 [Guillardia theta CCMP2712]|uniref:Uncharacterized protein n=1 Tax=Guillardia theta (strain CCMP2712) TaxID=905079 RepID=L1K2E8_GUITC|nr:hypothetical protein GUITHDRAFT_132251 [Guillardia theta CCMP2712]EKX54548.1 hypothetical protein GUITHDRAFT_132251 [Guillardia theta CCMP2712]|eukprot:XP_005841528.1 hypothetical protein GUITHDRAFT_132251 [Guillardia theta CCMP2712]